MCWTLNKDDKLSYLMQMGEWYLKEGVDNEEVKGLGRKAAETCSVTPVVSCHYSDKPSVVKCNDSPKRDKTGKPFW